MPLVYDPAKIIATKLWDATTGQMVRDLEDLFKKEYQSAAAFSLDGKLLAVGRGGEANGPSGIIILLDPATGKKVHELKPGHEYGVTDLVFHPDGKHLASAGRDTVVRLWSLADGKMVKELGKPRGGQFKDWIHAISFSSDRTVQAAAEHGRCGASMDLPDVSLFAASGHDLSFRETINRARGKTTCAHFSRPLRDLSAAGRPWFPQVRRRRRQDDARFPPDSSRRLRRCRTHSTQLVRWQQFASPACLVKIGPFVLRLGAED